MKRAIWILLGLAVVSAALRLKAADDPAAVLARYLKMEIIDNDTPGDARQARWKTLEELKATPESSVKEIIKVLPGIKEPQQRQELAGALRWFPTKESAAKLCDLLNDPEPGVRNNATHSLRFMSRRVDRSGGKRIQTGEQFAPQVDGLVPFLVKASEDPVDINRWTALYALADTLDPAAVVAMRKRLKDDSAEIRLIAACLLTEFHDTSGLEEMKKALARYQTEKPTPETEFQMTLHSELLLASFERITGKSFGEIPLNPILASSGGQELNRRYKELLNDWSKWWAWEPAK